MPSPQVENGYTRISNELLEALCTTKISGREWRVLMALIRETYGFNRKGINSTLSFLSYRTGIDRKKVHDVVSGLKSKGMVKVTVPENGDTFERNYSVEKDFSKWVVSPRMGTVPENGDKVSPRMGTTLKASKVSKETIKKPSCSRFEEKHLELARHLSRLIRKNCPKNITIKPSQGPQWANIFRLMEQRDGADGKGIPLDEIRTVIDWSFTDDFWSAQIQSAGSIRKHWNKLVTKMNKENPKPVDEPRPDWRRHLT